MTGLQVPAGSLGPWSGGEVLPGVVCVLAPNAGPMTLDGTNTWIIAGDRQAILIDPGPEDDEHLEAVRHELEVRGTRLIDIVLTHGHADHSEGAVAFADAFDCGVRAVDPHHQIGAGGLVPGDVLSIDGAQLTVVSTPGHSGDSASLVLVTPHGSGLLTGDTVLGRGTTVVAHPDGRLAEYLTSLHLLRAQSEIAGATHVLPGHGPALADPVAVIDYYVAHRAERLEQVAAAVAVITTQTPAVSQDDLVQAVVEWVYIDVPRVVWPAATLSVRAQLEYLRERGDLPSN